MNMIKRRCIALILVFTLLCSLITTASADTSAFASKPSDSPANLFEADRFLDYVNLINEKNMLAGIDDERLNSYGIIHGDGAMVMAARALCQAAIALVRIMEGQRLQPEPAEPSGPFLDYTLERLPDSYQETVSAYPNWAAWCDLTAVADQAGQITYLFTVGTPVHNLDPSFPGCEYLSAVLTGNDAQAWGSPAGIDAALIGPYVEGVAPVRLADGACGYCDQTGNLLIAPVFQMAGALVEGTAIVQGEDGNWYVLTLDKN